MAESVDTIIVGAGIAGLTIAYRLSEAGKSFALIEAQESIGGCMQTTKDSGYLLELGPNSTFARESLVQLAKDTSVAHEISELGKRAKQKFLVVDKKNRPSRLCPVPMGLFQAATTPILSSFGKLRLFAEPFIPKGKETDESVHSFVSRRLGKELAEKVVAAALTGVWAADIKKLSSRSALSKLWEAEKSSGSILVGMNAQRKKKPKAKGSRQMITFSSGIAALPKALANAIPASSTHCDCRVTSMNQKEESIELITNSKNGGELCYNAKHVVLTTPALTTAELLTPTNKKLAKEIGSVPYAPVGVLHVCIQKSAVRSPITGFGFLAPPKEGRALLGAIYSSSLFPERAPEGEYLLTCFVGGAVGPELSDVSKVDVQNNVLETLQALLKTKSLPKVVKHTYYPQAIPNYPVGHHELQDKVDSFHKDNPHIHLLSNWLKGLSVADRIDEAEELARKLIATAA
jgi:oxygen-dependent protoporphyrinogen oxidase